MKVGLAKLFLKTLSEWRYLIANKKKFLGTSRNQKLNVLFLFIFTQHRVISHYANMYVLNCFYFNVSCYLNDYALIGLLLLLQILYLYII